MRHALLLALAAAATLLACGDITESTRDPDGVAAVVVAVVVTPAADTAVALGDSVQFTAVARDADGNAMQGRTFVWSSSQPTVATINPEGLATALLVGTTVIRVETAGISGSANLVVRQEVASVAVAPDTVLLSALGDTARFTAEAHDANGSPLATQTTFTWGSSDTTVATVDGTGLATAVANGTVTISAEAAGVLGNATLGITQTSLTVVLSVTTDKVRYAPSDTVTISLLVVNGAGRVVTLEFADSQRYDFLIQDAIGNVVWRWAADKLFALVLGNEVLAHRDSLAYSEQYDGGLNPGAYVVVGIVVATNQPLSASVSITVQ